MNRDKIEFFKHITHRAFTDDTNKGYENAKKCLMYYFDHIDILYDFLSMIAIDHIGKNGDIFKHIYVTPHDFLQYDTHIKSVTFDVKVNEPSILNDYSIYIERTYYGGKYNLKTNILDNETLSITITEN